MCVHIHRAHHLVAGAQRQRQHAVHPQPTHPRPEPRPAMVPAQRPGPHRHAGRRGSDTRTLTQAVLDVIDLPHERRALHDGVRPVHLDQRQPRTLGAGNGLHRIGRDPRQQVLQTQPGRGQPRQRGQALRQIVVLRGDRTTRRNEIILRSRPGVPILSATPRPASKDPSHHRYPQPNRRNKTTIPPGHRPTHLIGRASGSIGVDGGVSRMAPTRLRSPCRSTDAAKTVSASWFRVPAGEALRLIAPGDGERVRPGRFNR